jgi:dephospho-CoA kinase
MFVIGLTGGIASCKSTISEVLAERGATIVDADKVGHEAYQPGSEGWQAVVAAFGTQIVAENGEIDRKALGALVFAEPAQRERLQAIIWPVMKRMMARRLDAFRAEGRRVVVIEAAVLLEARWQDLVDEVWVVTVPVAVAEARVIARNGLTPEQAQARIAAQLSNEERTRQAAVVIDNSSTIAAAKARVGELWNARVAPAARASG